MALDEALHKLAWDNGFDLDCIARQEFTPTRYKEVGDHIGNRIKKIMQNDPKALLVYLTQNTGNSLPLNYTINAYSYSGTEIEDVNLDELMGLCAAEKKENIPDTYDPQEIGEYIAQRLLHRPRAVVLSFVKKEEQYELSVYEMPKVTLH